MVLAFPSEILALSLHTGFYENFESLILSMRLSRPYIPLFLAMLLHKTFLNVTGAVLKICMQLDLHSSVFFLVFIPLVVTRPCVCKRALGIKKKKINRGTRSWRFPVVHNFFILCSCVHLSYLNISVIKVLPHGIS